MLQDLSRQRARCPFLFWWRQTPEKSTTLWLLNTFPQITTNCETDMLSKDLNPDIKRVTRLRMCFKINGKKKKRPFRTTSCTIAKYCSPYAILWLFLKSHSFPPSIPPSLFPSLLPSSYPLPSYLFEGTWIHILRIPFLKRTGTQPTLCPEGRKVIADSSSCL